MKDVIEESRRQPVLVDFWAPWCGPCKQLTPVLEKAVRAAKGKVKLVKMNIDEHPTIPGQMGIQSIPAVFAFVNGQPVDGFLGALPESQIVAFLERVTKGEIGGEEKELLKAADAALAEGDAAGAAELYSEMLAAIPRTSARLRDLRAATWKPAISSRRSAPWRWCRRPSATTRPSPPRAQRSKSPSRPRRSGRSAELEKKVAADPLDHQARFDLAVALNANNRRQEALDQLMEIVRRDRKWNDDGARKQLVQFFEAWGPTDEFTIAGRRRLSSILFA